jgi:HSP20 family protein
MTTHALEPFRPDRALTTLEHEMERFMDGFFGRRFRRFHAGQWAAVFPEIEMYDQKDEVIVKAEVPGLEKAGVQVTIDGEVLTIKGERKREREVKEEDYYCSERSYGAFSRSIELPVAVRRDKITATLTNGVLQIRLPKAEEAKNNQVSIEVK